MKTLQEIKSRMDELNKVATDNGTLFKSKNLKPSKEEKKAGREMKLLVWIRNFLETSPNESFATSEIKRLEALILSKTPQYKQWLQIPENANMDYKKAKTLFNKESGITKAKSQIKMLKFILQ
jgi:hypothetical protein